MAPPPPPGLMDDLIGEILLRLPPDDPACLVRASLTCKQWRSLVLDGAFHRQYRAFHRTAPVLGFFHDEQAERWGDEDGDDIFVPRFVPTTTMQTPPALPQPAARAGPGSGAKVGQEYSCRTLDCRHGRVVLHTVILLHPSATLTVWDPVTGDHKSFSLPSDVDPYYYFTAAVLCASASASDGGGCDHLECSGGPFLVVIAGVSHGVDYDKAGVAWARVYSSETAAWGAPTTLDLEGIVDPVHPCLLAAGAVYFMLDDGTRILKYDLAGGGALSVMKGPPQPQRQESNMIFATARDGELGAATVEGSSLHLWSWDGDDGVGEWTRVRVIELDTMIPISMRDPSTDEFDLAGFAQQGAGLIFFSANDDHRNIFTIELKSGHVTKTDKTRNSGKIFPLTSFYTPGTRVLAS